MKNLKFIFLGIIFLLFFTSFYFVCAKDQSIKVDYNFLNNISVERVVDFSSILLEINLDRDATCRYSNTKNLPYEYMSGNFEFNFGRVYQTNLAGLSDGMYRYYVKCVEDESNITSEPAELEILFRVNSLITGQVLLSESAPLSEGRVEINLVTSKLVSGIPILTYSFDGIVYNPLVLVGSGKTWKSYLVIEKNQGEGILSFKFKGTDLEGRVGEDIVSGAVFEIDTIKPLMIPVISATGNVGKINLDWYFEEDYEEFKVYRSLYSGVDYTDYYKISTNTKFVDSLVEKGKTYYYRVSAVDGAGNEGDLSVEVYSSALLENSSDLDTGLDLSLIGVVDSFLSEVGVAIDDVKNINSAISMKSEKEKELFSILKLGDDVSRAILDLESLKRDVEKYKLQDLTRDSLFSKIDSSRLKIDVIKKRIPEDIVILNEDSMSNTLSEEEMEEAIFVLKPDVSERVVTKSIKNSLKKIEEAGIKINSNFYTVEVVYSDGTKKRFSIVERDINAVMEKEANSYFLERFSEEVLNSAKIKINNLNYEIIKDDSVFGFLSDTKKIFYFIDKEIDMDVLRSINIDFVSLVEEDMDLGITGYFSFDLEKTKSTGVVVSILLLGIFGIYLFYKFKNNFSDQYIAINSKISLILNSLKKNDIAFCEKEYVSLKKDYSRLLPKERQRIFLKLDDLHNKILIHKLKIELLDLRSNLDRNSFLRIEKIYKKLSGKYKKKLSGIFEDVRKNIEEKEINDDYDKDDKGDEKGKEKKDDGKKEGESDVKDK